MHCGYQSPALPPLLQLIRRNNNLSFKSGVAARGLQFADDNNAVTGTRSMCYFA